MVPRIAILYDWLVADDLLDVITVDLDGGCLTVPENIKITQVSTDLCINQFYFNYEILCIV